MWITFEPVSRQDCLEFVRGSHRGTLYNTSAFDPPDETTPIFDGLPRLPDIEADRAHRVVGHRSRRRGGVASRHAPRWRPNPSGSEAQQLSLRFFGRDAVYAQRPGGRVGPRVLGLHDRLTPGMPFRDATFPDLTATAV